MIFGYIMSALLWIASILGIISFGTYALMLVAQQLFLRIPNNLKKRYNCTWALVTGASSGIGKALTVRLAAQGINVVMVALDNKDLQTSFLEMERKFPEVRFRSIGADLGNSSMDYMTPILEETDDIIIQLVFNNAGFILPGMIPDTDYPKVRANIECNAVCATAITHHFTALMIKHRRTGLVAFTSSAAGYMGGPTATTYSATKAFITNYGVSIASDLRDVGIDVLVMHPSPVNTNFYTGTKEQMASLASAQKLAVGPMVIADEMIAGAGRLTVWDQGLICAVMRIATKTLDSSFLAEVMARVGYLAGDHPRMAAKSEVRRCGQKGLHMQ